MNFESLPNEILLEIFDYFHAIELFDSFYELNQRFTCLLYKQYRTFRLNLISISKQKFDFICQQHLPYIIERISSLSLSNGIETIQQIELFLFSQQSIDKFTHLRSLTLAYLNTYEIIRQCFHLHHLNHLKFYQCNFTLKRLGFCLPTKISTSLQRLTWIKFIVKLSEINTLYQYTPNLRHLSISISDPHIDYEPSIFPSLRSAHLVFHTFDLFDISSLFHQMSNLTRLKIKILFNLIDGREWKRIIRRSLSKLRIFDFQMKSTFDSDENMYELVHSYLESFRNSFWINEHQWFVRCYSCKTTIYLSTQFIQSHTDTFPDVFLSTQSNDSLQTFSNHLMEISDENFFDNPLPMTIRLMNIHSLTIRFPINEQFWSIVTNFNRLRQLTIYVNTTTTQSEVERLFHRISYLDRLSINEIVPLSLQKSLFKHVKTSIQQVDIQGCELSFMNEEEQWNEFTNLSFIINCQVLFIRIDNHRNILDLIKNLHNLRALIIQYEENLSVQWLKNHLPSTYSIEQDQGFGKSICIWK